MSKVVRVSRDGAQAVVRVSDAYVRVNLATHATETSDSLGALTAGGGWTTGAKVSKVVSGTAIELAEAALTSLNVSELATTEKRRVYRVPNVVKDEALKALAWARASTSKKFDENYVQLAARISTSVSVDIDTVRKISELLSNGRPMDEHELSSDGTPSLARISYGLVGGDSAQRWTSRVLDKHKSIVAGAFTYDAACVYLGAGDDENSTKVNRLYMVTPEGEVSVREGGEWLPSEDPQEPLVIQLDAESAATLADFVDNPSPESPDGYLELRSILPIEYNLWDLAQSEVDFEMLDRIALAAAGVWDDGRAPQERSESASRQGRDSGGQFGPGGVDPKGDKLNVFARGRLPSELPLLTDVNARINQYIVSVEGQAPAEAPADEPVVASPAPETTTVEQATPDTATAKPLYVAVVDAADATAVLDLVAVIPAQSGTNQGPTAWRRSKGTWEFAPDLMADLQSVSPPPVVELSDENMAKAVIAQVDQHDADQPDQADGGTTMAEPVAASGMWGPHGEILPIYAAGVPTVADTPKEIGNAERLRQYWTHGEGAAKIRWGEPGDWYRCVSHLSKYMGTRAKGYCTLRHHDAIGVYPGQEDGGDHGHAVRASADRLAPIKFQQSVLTMSALAASIQVGADDIAPMPYDDAVAFDLGGMTVGEGGAFVIPLLIPEDHESGDGRSFDEQSLTHRDLPIPLLWQVLTGNGHDGAAIVGRIDTIERLPEGGLGRACGVFDVGPYGREAERLVRGGFLRGVSADLDKFVANTYEEDADEAADGSDEQPADEIKNEKIRVSQARVMAATLVPKPAFQECTIHMADEDYHMTDIDIIEDGIYEEAPGDAEEAEVVLASLAASAAPVKPPRGWFSDPNLDGPTPITVDDDGRVYGHIAAFNVDHIGLPRATKPPKSASKYAYFRTGVLRTEEGDDVTVGQLTLAGGHAPLSAGAESAVKHYDDTASAVADVAAGEDRHGIWVAGALRPGVTPEQVRVLRASAPSGDWRPINGKLELVAVCQVNVPGFPVARTMVAGGQVQALVAAGARYMAELRDHPVTSLAQRVEAIENEALQQKREAALARLEPQRRARHEALTAAAEAARARIAPTKEKQAAEKEALIASANAARARMGRQTMDADSVGEPEKADDSNF